jgi:hypothetical protein
MWKPTCTPFPNWTSAPTPSSTELSSSAHPSLTQQLGKQWFEEAVTTPAREVVAPMLAAPDLMVRRADGSIEFEVFFRYKAAYHYPSPQSSLAGRYDLKPGVDTFENLVSFI